MTRISNQRRVTNGAAAAIAAADGADGGEQQQRWIGRTAPADGADGGARRVLGDALGICRKPLEEGVNKIETKTDEGGQ